MSENNNELRGALAEAVLSQRPEVHGFGNMPPIAFVPGGVGEFNLVDLEKYLPTPLRKKGMVKIHELNSFIDTVKRQGSLTNSSVYLDVDYGDNKVNAVAIFNDHTDKDHEPGWRDHRAAFYPRFSDEWKRWSAKSGTGFEQIELAHFFERNVSDIVGDADANLPSGAEVLEFVSKLEETRKVKYGSAVNLQSGKVQFEFIEDDAGNTKGKLDMFREFAIGISPFQHGDSYRIKAFLRYRIDRNTGQIKFWYELQNPEKVLEDACKVMIGRITAECGVPVFFGTPE